MRLDQYLHEEGLCQSRERAKALIMAGTVYVDGEKADKPGVQVREGAKVELRGKDHPYVSRGGLKLEKAIERFGLRLEGRVCIDVGASTGGFTDCMLQNGAVRVYAVDVGYGQLAWSLRCDERVVVMERCNIRHLDPDTLTPKPSFFSVDVSFISLKLVLPVLREAVGAGDEGVCLVKPQFEAGREKVGKKGVVREAATHIEVLHAALQHAASNGFVPLALSHSPIRGPEGNIEFLLHLRKGDGEPRVTPEDIERVVNEAAASL